MFQVKTGAAPNIMKKITRRHWGQNSGGNQFVTGLESAVADGINCCN